ncbi:MAG: DNA-protecting protein DprA [Oceanospirillaceae bacterium]|nr:DNA-protecting protein DprA [Oceanospirillaceae bacterium]
MSELLSWLQLTQLPISRRQQHKLLERSGSVTGLFNDVETLAQLQYHCDKRGIELPTKGELYERAQALHERCALLGWSILTSDMSEFPERLLDIPDPPVVLFVKGRSTVLSGPQLAIVGSRKASPLGAKVAHRCAKHLSDWGVSIVSGLAKGIDTAAHQGALEGGSPTLAVLANGPGPVYPRANQQLAEQILEQGGALITENPPGCKLEPWRFPERNRLISGLTLGTLVVEAGLKSGSLVTANLAASQGREVFAIPGALSNPEARGCHQLIKQGAVLVESPEDILSALHRELREFCPVKVQPDLAPGLGDSPLLRFLGASDMTLEELLDVSGLSVRQLQIELAQLELGGVIVRRSGRYFRNN